MPTPPPTPPQKKKKKKNQEYRADPKIFEILLSKKKIPFCILTLKFPKMFRNAHPLPPPPPKKK